MHRVEITAAIVQEADRLLAEGVDYATISARLGITEYVVGVMAGDQLREGRPQPRDVFDGRRPNRQNAVDAATVRMIQRMLAVGILKHHEIAREAGVSPAFVGSVALGRRAAVDTSRPPLNDGEQFLKAPIRCSGCHGMISIVPCRLCKARRQREFDCSDLGSGLGTP